MKSPDVWTEVAAGLTASIPARSELIKQKASGAYLAGLAAAFYRLKEGQSVWLSIPSTAASELDAAIHYAHQVRLSALHGTLRANAFNRPTLLSRTDLVVWTQSSFQYSRLRHHSDLGVQQARLGRTGGLELGYPGRVLRTLLCSSAGSLTGLCDQLQQHTQPFLHLVDLTPFGDKNEAKNLLDHLETYFPTTPILILTDCSDSTIEPVIIQSRRHYSLWRQQCQDDTGWVTVPSMRSELRLIVIPDERLENPLVKVLRACQNLKDQLHRSAPVAKQLMPILYRVIRTLRSLTYPITFHEEYQATHRRGGLYPAMPLEEWLGRASRIELPTGQSENTRDSIIIDLRAVLAQLSKGKSGKQQAMEHWLARYTDTPARILIITGSESEAKALRQWLLRAYGAALEARTLRVVGINSSREIYRELDATTFDRALVVTALWDSDLWCLSLARTVEWLGYPIEHRWQARVSRLVSARQVASPEQKLAWWQWQTIKYPMCSSQGPDAAVEEWRICRGQYERHNHIEVTLPEDDHWLEALMVPPPERLSKSETPPVAGEVTVVTDQGGHFRYHENQKVYILTGSEGRECLDTVRAKDLEQGSILVELDEDENASLGLFDTLIEYATDNSLQFRTYQALVDRWHSLVDEAIRTQGGLEGFRHALSRKGITIGLPQLKNWASHNLIGPNNSDIVVPAVALLSGLNLPAAQVRSIQNAQKHIKGLHTSLGKTLKAIVLASCAPNTAVIGNLALTDNQRQLSALVRLESIRAVHVHPAVRINSEIDLETLLRDSVAASNGRLFATGNAYRSARESPFGNLEHAKACIDFLANQLYEVYGSRSRSLPSAIEHAQKHHIRFSGDSSDLTKGQYSSAYRRLYQGEVVDIGQHIGIGTSREPQRCLRIHFHWDSRQKQIVIHHAGRHLPTSQG